MLGNRQQGFHCRKCGHIMDDCIHARLIHGLRLHTIVLSGRRDTSFTGNRCACSSGSTAKTAVGSHPIRPGWKGFSREVKDVQRHQIGEWAF